MLLRFYHSYFCSIYRKIHFAMSSSSMNKRPLESGEADLPDVSTKNKQKKTAVEEIDIKMPTSFPIRAYYLPSIREWYKKEGDRIAPGDKLVSLGADRSDIEFDFEADNLVFDGYLGKSDYEMDVSVSRTMPKGTIVKLCKQKDEKVERGDVLCKIQIDDCTPE